MVYSISSGELCLGSAFWVTSCWEYAFRYRWNCTCMANDISNIKHMYFECSKMAAIWIAAMAGIDGCINIRWHTYNPHFAATENQ